MGRTFGVCPTHSSIPQTLHLLIKKQPTTPKIKKPVLTYTVSQLFLVDFLALGINGIFVGKDPTHLLCSINKATFCVLSAVKSVYFKFN